MKTPYIPHTFGEDVNRKLRSRVGWLTAGVASSISWPSFDVCVKYAGDEFFLRGSERDRQTIFAPKSPLLMMRALVGRMRR